MTVTSCCLDRRKFLTLSSTLAIGSAARGNVASTATNPLCVFTKPFNSLSFDELARRIAELGFDGIEAPIRKGGHVEPHEVEDKLPKLVDALSKHGWEITVMTSDINDAADPMTEKVLRTAATLGIKRYRMKYEIYDAAKPIRNQLAMWQGQFRDLAAMNHEFGIQGLYQNHAGGSNLGASLWDLAEVLDGIDFDKIGVAYDIRHAMVEGGMSWPVTFRMIQPHVETVYVKDFAWEGKRVRNVPLGKGNVDPKFFAILRQFGFSGPVSLHEEYLDHRQAELVPQHLAAI